MKHLIPAVSKSMIRNLLTNSRRDIPKTRLISPRNFSAHLQSVPRNLWWSIICMMVIFQVVSKKLVNRNKAENMLWIEVSPINWKTSNSRITITRKLRIMANFHLMLSMSNQRKLWQHQATTGSYLWVIQVCCSPTQLPRSPKNPPTS